MEKSGVELAAENSAAFLGAMDKASGSLKEFGKEAEGASEKGGFLSRALSGIGDIAGGALKAGLFAGTAAIGAIAGAVGASIATGIDWAGQLDSIQDRIGGTSEEAAALAVAVQGVGGDVGTFTAGLAKMQKGLETTDGKLGPTGKVLDSLGISFRDVDGNMLDMSELLPQVADKLNGMQDGAEKSALMMDLFGGAGKDLGDVLGALAEGGLAAADEKAKALGLSLSGETVESTVQMGKDMETLKQTLQGVGVTIFTNLLPAIQPMIADFAKFAQEVAPIVGQWLKENIPIAIQTASDFFNNTLKPAIEKIWAFIQDPLIPIISDIVDWLKVNIPIAIQTASDFWNNTLKPALEKVWAFIQEHVIPIIEDVVEWLQENIPIAIERAADFWENTLKPAIETVWAFIKDDVIPIIEDIVEWLQVNIPAAIESAQKAWDDLNKALDTVQETWERVWGGIQTFVETTWDNIVGAVEGGVNSVIDAINRVIEAYNSLPLLPDIDPLAPVAFGNPGGGAPVRPPANPGAQAAAPSYSSSTVHNWNWSVNTPSGVGGVYQSYQMARALVGV